MTFTWKELQKNILIGKMKDVVQKAWITDKFILKSSGLFISGSRVSIDY